MPFTITGYNEADGIALPANDPHAALAKAQELRAQGYRGILVTDQASGAEFDVERFAKLVYSESSPKSA